MENPVSYAKHHKYIMGILVLVVVLGTAVGSRLINKKAPAVNIDRVTKVTLIGVSEFLKDKTNVSANGTVESLEQADLRSQASGPVTSVRAQIGQKIKRGQILVTLQNDDIAAGLAQANALLRSQQARLDDLKNGARTEQVQLAESALNAAKQGLVDTKTTQDAIVSNAYSNLLNNGLSAVPNKDNQTKARITLSGSYNLNQEGIYTITLPQGGDKPPFSVTGIETVSGWVTRGTALKIGNGGLYFTVSTDGEIFPGDKWTITIPNLEAPTYSLAKNGYDTAKKVRDAAVNGATNAVQTAQKSYDLTLAGASNDQIKAQAAAVEQAAASVQAVQVQLERTFIRSPIDGELTGLPVKFGELVNPGALVASVVGQGGLQIKSFISDSDLPFVSLGSDVVINDNLKGKVTGLSPSIDANTKNAELRIVVEDPKRSGLVIGQSVNIQISTQLKNGKSSVYLLPLQAVKIANEGASVFVVKPDSTLEEKTVKLGAVNGEFVEVVDGITPDLKIVSTIYELKAGEKVGVE